MRKFLALVLLTASMSAAPRWFSPEHPVGDPKLLNNALTVGPIDIAAGGVFQWGTGALACAGSTGGGACRPTGMNSILAAWSDPRSGTHRDIYATRLDGEGNALDPNGIPFDLSPLDKQLLRLIWDGKQYVALWKSGSILGVTPMHGIPRQLVDNADFTTTADLLPGVLLCTIGGQVTAIMLDDQYRAVSTWAIDPNGANAKLVRSGTATLAVWLHDSTLLAQRVDSGASYGIPLQIATIANGMQIATAPALLAYADMRTVHVLDMQPNGVLTPRATYTAAGVESIASMSDGGFIAVANRQLRRFDASGNFIDSLSIDGFFTPRLTSAHGTVFAAAIANGPVSYVWRSAQPRGISSIAPVQTRPRIASDGTNALLIWNEQLPTDHLMAQLVSVSGEPIGQPLVFPALAADELPAVGFDGKTYVLIRTTPRPGHIEISAQRIARDGTLDGAAFLLADSQAKIHGVTIAGDTVAWIDEGFTLPHLRWTTLDSRIPMLWNPANEVAVGTDGKDVMIAASGTSVCGIEIAAMQGAPIPITDECTEGGLAIAGNGAQWLLVYGDGSQLYARYLQHDGSPIGEPLVLGVDRPHAPSVAWDGDAFVVTFQSGPFVEVGTVRGRDVEYQLGGFSGAVQESEVAGTSAGALMAYSRTTQNAAYSARVYTRALSRPRVRPVVR